MLASLVGSGKSLVSELYAVYAAYAVPTPPATTAPHAPPAIASKQDSKMTSRRPRRGGGARCRRRRISGRGFMTTRCDQDACDQYALLVPGLSRVAPGRAGQTRRYPCGPVALDQAAG